jgi:hypothetical protein
VLTLALALGVFTPPGTPQPAALPCTETPPIPAAAAALKPSDVLLAISAPRAGETVVEMGPTDSITLSVDYWGPRLVPAHAAHTVDEYHLAFLLDMDATPYIGTLMPVPHCHPHIIHSASTRVTLDNVPHGSHSLAVLLIGSNEVCVNPPVAARVTFVVK